MAHIRDEEIDYMIKQAAEGDKITSKRLFEHFVSHALMDEWNPPHPKVAKYIAQKLLELEQSGAKGVRKIFNLQTKRELNRTNKLLEKFQKVLDVNYCFKSGLVQGADGACALLNEKSEHYNNANISPERFRQIVSELEKDIFNFPEYTDSVEKLDSDNYIQRGQIMAEWSWLIGIHSTDPFSPRDPIDSSGIEMVL